MKRSEIYHAYGVAALKIQKQIEKSVIVATGLRPLLINRIDHMNGQVGFQSSVLRHYGDNIRTGIDAIHLVSLSNPDPEDIAKCVQIVIDNVAQEIYNRTSPVCGPYYWIREFRDCLVDKDTLTAFVQQNVRERVWNG